MLRRFLKSRSGNVASLFALSAIPLVAAMGAAVDFSRAYQFRSMTQDALDAAALAANRLIGIKSEAEVRAEAARFYAANTRRVPNAPPYTMVISGGEVTLRAQLHVDTYFTGLVGLDEIVMDLMAHTIAGNATYEVVLALDNTGSMSGSKITTLRTAARDLVNTLFDVNALNTQPNPIQIGLVPFASAVNVGPTYANASWMDTGAIAPTADDMFTNNYNNNNTRNRFAIYNQLRNVTWAGCVENRPYPFDVNDAVPTTADPRTLFVPMFAPDGPDAWSQSDNDYLPDTGGNCPTTACPSNQSASWCNTNNRAPKTADFTEALRQARTCKYNNVSLSGSHNNGRAFGPNFSCVSNPLLPMTANRNTILTQIAAMPAEGNTNIHDGLMWGWRLLSPTEPFTQGREYNAPNNFKILILMTDGDNTYTSESNINKSSYASYGFISPAVSPAGQTAGTGLLGINTTTNSTMVNAMNQRTREACANIKATDDILIYTIGFQVSTQATINMLRDCATEPSMAYQSTSNADLIAVFQAIAANITTLRVAE
ncbi:MAG: pilus assembly protein [Bauldia sp.]|nr:pilus assembly protein [Bauldia sp.]